MGRFLKIFFKILISWEDNKELSSQNQTEGREDIFTLRTSANLENLMAS